MVIIITYSDYPNGSPGAIRYATFAQTYADMGYNVMILNKSYHCCKGRIQSEPLAMDKSKYARAVFFGYRCVQTMKRLCNYARIDGVIIGSDVFALHSFAIRNWCRSQNINCVFDVTEWYSKEQFTKWRLSIDYWQKELVNRFVIDKHSRVIAISSYLYEYFNAKGCKVTQVPIFHNIKIQNESCISRNISDRSLNIIYAGSHILMDNIPLIIEAISLLPEEKLSQVRFTIYGINETQIASAVPGHILKVARKSLYIMGRRPNEEVVSAYSNSDFCVVLRDPTLRVNKAGFPSKIVESMRLGIPVICNYSSDLDKYLTHKKNSIIVKHLTASALCEQFKVLLEMSSQEKFSLGDSAIRTIKEKLDSKLFQDNLRTIII